MRLLLLLSLLLAASCSDTTKPQQQLPVVSVTAAATVPAEVQQYLQTNLPGWNIPNKQDYDRSFWSFYDSTTLPFCTATDLDDDGLVDYGVLIKKQDSVQMVILLGRATSFIHRIADNFHPAVKELQYCIQPEPPGQVDIARPAIRSLILTSNAINLLQMENRVCIYYWDGTKVSVFQTM